MKRYFVIGTMAIMVILTISNNAFADDRNDFMDKTIKNNSLLSPEILKELTLVEEANYEFPEKIIDLGKAENAIDNTLFWMNKILKSKWVLDERNKYYVGKAKNGYDMVSCIYNKGPVYFQINSTFSDIYLVIRDDSQKFSSPADLIKGYVEEYFNYSDVILKYFSLEEQKDKKIKFKIDKKNFDSMPDEYKGKWYFFMNAGVDLKNNTVFFSIYKNDGSLPIVPTPKKNWFE